MAQITITLESETEAIAFLEMLKAKKEKSGELTPNTEPIEPETEKKMPAKKTVKEKKSAPPEEKSTEETNTPEISLTDVRAAALKLSKAGKQKLLKEIFAKYDAEKLSDIGSENYESLMADLEAANE